MSVRERLAEAAAELVVVQRVDRAVAVEVERGVEARLPCALAEGGAEGVVVGGVEVLAAVAVAEEAVERQRRAGRHRDAVARDLGGIEAEAVDPVDQAAGGGAAR